MRTLIVLLLALCGWPNLAAAQTYTLAPEPVPVVMDNSGNIVNLGCVWTYLAGTSTLATTYTTSSGTANANPIIADSAGRYVAYLTPGTSYKFVFENVPCSASSHGSTLATRDNIAAVPVSGLNVDITGTVGASVAAGDLLYLSAGDGALNAGQWYAADADNTYSSTTAVTVGFATAAITSGTSGSMRTTGRVTGLSGLTAGEIYYASATAAGLTATPPTNARCIGKADSTTSIVIPCDAAVLRLPDSDGTHSYVVNTTSNLTADRLISMNFGDAAATISWSPLNVVEGRLTLTSATPVTTADVTAATTLYWALYAGNRVGLYTGSAWVAVPLAQLSIAVPATTATMYDVFIDYTAGSPVLELVAWTNDTTRATALATQDGVYVQTGDADSRYVGSFRTTGVSGQTEDSFAKRYVWNYYNRVVRPMRVLEATNSWTYADSANWQQANASTANQLDFIVGVAEVMLHAEVMSTSSSDTAGDDYMAAIGLDSTTVASTAGTHEKVGAPVAGYFRATSATLDTYPAVGRHFAAWLERASATATIYGDNGGTDIQSGISGWMEM